MRIRWCTPVLVARKIPAEKRCWNGESVGGVVVLLGALSVAQAQSGPGTDASYAALRTLGLGNEAVSVTNLELNRDAGKFLLKSGTVCFAAAVNGKVTGAVFTGDGTFVLCHRRNRSARVCNT